MDHRLNIIPPSYVAPLTQLEKLPIMVPSQLMIDLDDESVFDDGGPAETLAGAMKLIRTLRQIAVRNQQHDADIHLGVTYRILSEAARIHNEELKKEMEGNVTRADTPTQQTPDQQNSTAVNKWWENTLPSDHV